MKQGSAVAAQASNEAGGSPQFPVLLNDEQSATCLGMSVRKFHELRSEPWMPRPVILGPRLLRWPRAELERAVADMPRQTVAGAEPLQLAKARAARSGITEVKA